MSSALHHLLASAYYWVKVLFLIVFLYRIWPRKRDFIQRFKKTTPEGLPIELTPNYFDFRSRIVVCLFVSGVLCFVLGDLFRRTFLPPAPPPVMAADPAPAPSPPKIARSSAARDGDVVEIVCGSSKLCALAATAPDAVKLNTGQSPNGKVLYVKNGTKALVTGYDPQDTGSDTADVSLSPERTRPASLLVPAPTLRKRATSLAAGCTSLERKNP